MRTDSVPRLIAIIALIIGAVCTIIYWPEVKNTLSRTCRIFQDLESMGRAFDEVMNDIARGLSSLRDHYRRVELINNME